MEIPTATPPVATLAPLVPYLTCSPAAAAIEWYGRVFGATVVGDVYPMGRDQPDSVGHAELRVGGSSIYLSDEHLPVGAVAPTTLGGATTAFVLVVEDMDSLYERAVVAGAAADRPPEDQPYGSRAGWFTDPFGHRWSIQTPLGDHEPTE